MAFQFCESMISDYRAQGYVVFRGILPESLLRDLRRATEHAADLARQVGGPQAQRLQPIDGYDIDLTPFEDYASLPALADAIARILTPEHRIGSGGWSHTGILIEPAERPYATPWHRDLRETSNVPDIEEFRRIGCDPLWFNQINCPLYEDNCTWYVPGSQLRQFDLPRETAAAAAALPGEDAGDEAVERGCLDYARTMPGAVRLHMDAGDLAFYHPNAWHLGVYRPESRRRTIHGHAPTPELLDWYERWNVARRQMDRARQQTDEGDA